MAAAETFSQPPRARALVTALLLTAVLGSPGCCMVGVPGREYGTPDEVVRALANAWAARDYRGMLSCLDDLGRRKVCGVVTAKKRFDRQAGELKQAIREHCGLEGVTVYEKSIQHSADSLFLSCFGWPSDGDPSGHLRTVVEGKGAYIYLDKEMLDLTAGRTEKGWIVLPPWYPEFRGVSQIAAMIDHSTARVRDATWRVRRGEVKVEDIPELLHH